MNRVFSLKVLQSTMTKPGDPAFAIGSQHHIVEGKVMRLLMKNKRRWFRENIKSTEVESVMEINDRTSQGFIATAGGAVAGHMLLGPAGAIVGALVAGKKHETVFRCRLRDGRSFVGVVNTDAFYQLKEYAPEVIC